MRAGPEPEVLEPGGRKHQLTEKMSSEDLAAAYGDATRLRAHELTWHLDGVLGNWMKDARDVLAERGSLTSSASSCPCILTRRGRARCSAPVAGWSARGPLSGRSSRRSRYAPSRRAEAMRGPVDELGTALHLTRMIRLGLEAMWGAVDALPDRVTTDPGVRPALVTISDWLDKVEEGELRDRLLTRNFAVIRPVSLVCPPSAGSLSEITAAIAVLSGHGLVIASDD